MKLNRSSGKRAGEIECSLSQEDLSTASATSIWIGFQAINGFVSWSALLSSTVCSVTSISFVEGKSPAC